MDKSVYFDGEKYAEGEIQFSKALSILTKNFEIYSKIKMPKTDIYSINIVSEDEFIESKNELSNLKDDMTNISQLLAQVRNVLSEDSTFESAYFNYMKSSITAKDLVDFPTLHSLINSTMIAGIGESYYKYIVEDYESKYSYLTNDFSDEFGKYPGINYTVEDYYYAQLWLKKQDLLRKSTIAEVTGDYGGYGVDYYEKQIADVSLSMFLIQKIQVEGLNKNYDGKYHDADLEEDKSHYWQLVHKTASENDAFIALIKSLSMLVYGSDSAADRYADKDSYVVRKASEVYQSYKDKFGIYDMNRFETKSEYDAFSNYTTDYYEHLPSASEIFSTSILYVTAYTGGGFLDFIEDPVKAFKIWDIHNSDLSEDWKQYSAKEVEDYSFYADWVVDYNENGKAISPIYVGPSLLDRDDIKGTSQAGKGVYQAGAVAAAGSWNPYAGAALKTFFNSTDKTLDLNQDYMAGEITSNNLKTELGWYTAKEATRNFVGAYLGSEAFKEKHPNLSSNVFRKSVDAGISLRFATAKAISANDFSTYGESVWDSVASVIPSALGDQGNSGKVMETFGNNLLKFKSFDKIANKTVEKGFEVYGKDLLSDFKK